MIVPDTFNGICTKLFGLSHVVFLYLLPNSDKFQSKRKGGINTHPYTTTYPRPLRGGGGGGMMHSLVSMQKHERQ